MRISDWSSDVCSSDLILDRMQSEIPLIPELAGHLIAGGGKRMRPMLTLACGKLLDYPGHRHCKLAAAVEFIHTATLLHDDVVDKSDLRRGRKTANMIWGNRSEEHTSELQSLMRISYAVFCLKKQI